MSIEALLGITPDTAETDVVRPRANDLMATAMLSELFAAIDARRAADPFYISDDENLESAVGLPPLDPMVFASHEAHDPYEDMLEHASTIDAYPGIDYTPSDGELGDVFDRYASADVDPEFGGPSPHGLQDIPTQPNDEIGNSMGTGLGLPSLRELQTGATELSRFGYAHTTTDPYGEGMREALRKLVRAV